jgi:hypothetical protein
MRAELSLTPLVSYPFQVLQRIHADLGSDYIVTGAYLLRGHRIHLDVMLFDVRTGRQAAAIGDESQDDALPDLARRCAGRVRAQLGVRLPDTGSSPSLRAASTEQLGQGMETVCQRDGTPAPGRCTERAALFGKSGRGGRVLSSTSFGLGGGVVCSR